MRNSEFVLPLESEVIWDQYFPMRVALAVSSMVAAVFWFFLGPGNAVLFGVFLQLHSLGMAGISAGFFGKRIGALYATLVVGLMWFVPIGILLQEFRRSSAFSFHGSVIGLMNLFMMFSPGLVLFFITWLLVRNSRQHPGHVRES